MKNIAIIPARGGSKRIPRKNIKPFMGKPIITYSIEAALQSGLFEEVMVSTDDEEIAGIACKYGAKVPFMRSAEMSNDYAGTDDVILEVLRKYKEQGREFETVLLHLLNGSFLSLPKDSGKLRKNEFGDRFRFHLCGLFLSYTAQPSHRGWKNLVWFIPNTKMHVPKI
mgnify:CR=1 FL=1